jgi:hypothetical protein
VLAITALAGLGTAAAAIGVAVASDGPDAVTLFPGAALSLTWIAALCAAALALDAIPGAERAGARVRGRSPSSRWPRSR